MKHRLEFLRSLASLLSRRQKLQAGLLCLATLLCAGLEAIGIGLVLPFITLISGPEQLQDHHLFTTIFDRLGISMIEKSALAIVTLILIAVFVLKNLFLGFVAYAQARFTNNVFVSVARRLLSVYLACPYSFHLQRNSAEIIRIITGDAHAISNAFLRPGFIIFSETMVILTVTALLLIAQPVVTLLSISLFGILGTLIYLVIRPRLLLVGERYLHHNTGMLQWINQSLGSIKEIKVLHREPYFVRAFEEHGQGFSNSAAVNQFGQQLPRLIMETFVVATILLSVLLILQQSGQDKAVLPLLALFGAAAFRLMPSATRIVTAMHQTNFSLAGLKAIEGDLHLVSAERLAMTGDTAPTGNPIPFSREISLENVSFHYEGADKAALEGVDLVIPKGTSLGVVGPSGAGKSTLIDLLMGLLRPTGGQIAVDGLDVSGCPEAWQRMIGYVPQSIFLLDDTIRHNVAFGLTDGEIDAARLDKAVATAQLGPVIDALPQGLDTVTGERGVRLSGGQRQRIAIARALYDDPEVLVMDEATAALDNETEREVTQAIEWLSKEKTIIVIAHRLSTVRNCDSLCFMQDGRISATGSIDKLMQHREFQKVAQLSSM